METRQRRLLEPLLAVALPLFASVVLLVLLSRNDLDGRLVGHVHGWDQRMRGVHDPSHNVWASMLAWTVACALYWGPLRGRLWRSPASWS